MRVDSALLGDVREMQRARAIRIQNEVVPEQARFERQRGGLDGRIAQRLSFAEHLSLHEEDVEVAIVVVVQQRHTRRQHLGIIEFAGHSVEIAEPQAALGRPIDEPLADAVRAACGGARRRRGLARRRI